MKREVLASCILLACTSCSLLFEEVSGTGDGGSELLPDADLRIDAIRPGAGDPVILSIEGKHIPRGEGGDFVIHGRGFVCPVQLQVGEFSPTPTSCDSETISVTVEPSSTMFGGVPVTVTNSGGEQTTLDPGVFFYSASLSFGSTELNVLSLLPSAETKISDLAAGDWGPGEELDLGVTFTLRKPAVFLSSNNYETISNVAGSTTIGNQTACSFGQLDQTGQDEFIVASNAKVLVFSTDRDGVSFNKEVVSVGVADTDGDGTVNVVMAVKERKKILISQWDGQALMGSESSIGPQKVATQRGNPMALSDMDNDGDVDIVLLTQNENNTHDVLVMRNEGGGFSYIDAWPIEGTSELVDLSLRDFNQDGLMDIVAIALHKTKNKVVVMTQQQSPPGLFLPTELNLGEQSNPTHMAIGDYNEDGWDDLWLADEDCEGKECGNLHLYLGKAGGGVEPTFEMEISLSSSPCGMTGCQLLPSRLLATDLNGDGQMDLVAGMRVINNGSEQGVGLYVIRNSSF